MVTKINKKALPLSAIQSVILSSYISALCLFACLFVYLFAGVSACPSICLTISLTDSTHPPTPSTTTTTHTHLHPTPVCTVPPGPVSVPENNTADIQLVKIDSGDDVALRVSVNPEDLFYLKGNALMVKKGLDYEVHSPNSWHWYLL